MAMYLFFGFHHSSQGMASRSRMPALQCLKSKSFRCNWWLGDLLCWSLLLAEDLLCFLLCDSVSAGSRPLNGEEIWRGNTTPVPYQLSLGCQVLAPYGSIELNSLCLHRDDLVDLYIEALQNSSFNGTYNATAPNPVRMSELCSSLGRVIGRPSWLPVPEFALQVLPSLPAFAFYPVFSCCASLNLPFSFCPHPAFLP